MSDISSAAAERGTASTGKSWFRRALPGWFLVLFGVILPLVTLLAELFTGMCAEVFFDPLPGWLHAALVLLVPVANLLVFMASSGSSRLSPALLSLLNGLAIGIAAWYTLAFLPLMPIAVMASVFGVGLLPLAPVFSLVAALVCRRRLARMQNHQGLPRLRRSPWPGITAALLTLVAAQLPASLTYYGLSRALAHDAQVRQQGIELLRSVGSEEELLLACYRRRGQITDMFTLYSRGTGNRVWPQDARPVYYRVTGRPFNSVPPPEQNLGGLLGTAQRTRFDRDLGGAGVAGRVAGLYLSDSAWNGSVDANGALAYLEWTFVVSNKSERPQEARLQLRLPPGGTASRVTLWINGEPREAAFAGKSQVREAYNSIVRRRMDPLLVTQSAPDTLMIQMFPVPAREEMKARIGITVPLQLQRPQSADLLLPQIIEKNFAIRGDLDHELWLESKQAIYDTSGLGTPRRDGEVFLLRAPVRHGRFNKGGVRIAFARDSRHNIAWTRDPHGDRVLLQRLSFARQAVDRGVIIVDGSMAMKDYREALAKVIEQLPADAPFSVILASDSPVLLHPDKQGFGHIAAALREHDYLGGSDNLPALKQAWDLAADHDAGALVWIHGPQPVDLSPVASLHAKWERRRQPLPLIDLAVGEGRNRIAEKLVDIPDYGTVGPLADPAAALQQVLQRFSGRADRVQRLRETVAVAPGGAWETSDHLGRLWARDRIDGLLRRNSDSLRQQAIALAQTWQVVSPVSGAVVLENARQYRQSGLDNPDGMDVPSVPEPEEWAMIIISLLMLAWAWRRRRLPGGALA